MLSEICIRQKGTNITAGEMKELHKINAPIKIFAAGNTTANLDYGDIPDRDVITKTSIIVKSRGNTFSFQKGDESNTENIKISKGEESNFIWCIFYSLFEQVIHTLNDKEEEGETEFDELE